jgi:hypothetical protein
MTPAQLKDFAYVMNNIDRDMLEQEGIIKPGQVGGGDWTRFNDEPMNFILKLSEDKLEKLASMITADLREGG